MTTPTPPPPDPSARLLRVYSDAEHELLSTLAREVDKQLVDPTDHRAEYIANVRATTARVVAGLEHGNRARVAAVVAKADTAGRTVAARQLAVATGRRRPAHEEPLNLGALDQLAAATADQLSAAHHAILRTVPDVYRSVISRAAVGTAIGTQTRRQAAQRAMWEFTRRGVTGFVDRAGRNWELSSYAEMATRTASARAAVDAQLAALVAGGHDLVIVSDHAGECYICRPWEGSVLSISGATPGYSTVATAREAGLLHPNCRHAFGVYLPGITRTPAGPGTGPDPEGEKARARQRAIERQIREWKRRQTAALDPSTRRYAGTKVRAWQGEMRTHLEQNPDLKRLSYRESPGAGNHPTAATYRDNPDGPFPDRDLRPNELSDTQLDDALGAAIEVEDFDRLDLLEVEADRRDAQKHADDARRADARQRAAVRKEREDDARNARYEQLLNDGVDDETAIEQVFGVSVEQQRRRAAIVQLRQDGLRGKGFDDLSRESYRNRINGDYAAAEDATNGYMLNKAGKRAGIDPRSLFTGPETRARKYGSEELRAWWDIHGRPTLDEHRAELLGETGAAGRLRSQRGDFLA